MTSMFLLSWGVKKPILYAYSKLFWCCLEVVLALFLALKATQLNNSKTTSSNISENRFTVNPKMIKTYAIWSKNVAPIENLSTQNLIFTLSAIYETILIFEGGSVSKSQENRFLRPEIVKIAISESQNFT